MQVKLLVIVTALLGATLLQPIYPRDQLLQHAPMIVVLPLLFLVAARAWISNGSMVCLVAFWILHIIGARYIYSFVPYDDWSRSALGISPNDFFGHTRNHYDRVVHLAFGFLFVVPIAEASGRFGDLRRSWRLLLAFTSVLALSAIYEIVEWCLSMMVSPNLADNYNGQQGDAWDAQKDMGLAAAGALLALIWAGCRRAPMRAAQCSAESPREAD